MNTTPFRPAKDAVIVNHAAAALAQQNNNWADARDLRQQIADRDRMIENLKRQLAMALSAVANR